MQKTERFLTQFAAHICRVASRFPRLERGYLLISLTIGASFVFVTPSFEVPDEPNHFYRAYQIACGKVLAERRDELWGGELPRSLVRTVDDTSEGIPFHPENKVSLKSIAQLIDFHPLKQKKQFVSFPNTAAYNPLPYLPQIVAIECGRLLGLSPLLLLYLGRLFNFSTAAFMCWRVLKIAPMLSNSLFLIVLAPMFIYEAASFSPDALTNSLSILLTATVLSCAFSADVRLEAAKLILLGTASTALGLCKGAYFLLPLV